LSGHPILEIFFTACVGLQVLVELILAFELLATDSTPKLADLRVGQQVSLHVLRGKALAADFALALQGSLVAFLDDQKNTTKKMNEFPSE
jgi:hypothetical protein